MNERERDRASRIMEIVELLYQKTFDDEQLVRKMMMKYLISRRTAMEYVTTAKMKL